TAAARVLAYWCAMQLDDQAQHPDPDRRAAAGDLAALLTPVVKAFLTELGHHGANQALGVLGGYGYIHEYGIEQQVRDSRVSLIYEGSNEIQSIDLVQRKLLGKGQGLALLLAEMSDCAAACDAMQPAPLAEFALAVRQQKALLQAGVAALREAAVQDAESPLRVADDALAGTGHALLAWAWARMALAAARSPEAALCERQRDLAQHGIDHLLDTAALHWARVQQWQRPLGWVKATAD
ncbi:acyl-CoA dehydrogenase family protein, partial [Ideonella sp.]|uniref:acyl-CoA dehydrogenase family protein n=1 Tax=Ideonella sp. TaxID=1929293 RepID=UPI003BB6FD4B